MQREANNKRGRKETGWLKDGVHKVDVGKESKVGRRVSTRPADGGVKE